MGNGANGTMATATRSAATITRGTTVRIGILTAIIDLNYFICGGAKETQRQPPIALPSKFQGPPRLRPPPATTAVEFVNTSDHPRRIIALSFPVVTATATRVGRAADCVARVRVGSGAFVGGAVTSGLGLLASERPLGATSSVAVGSSVGAAVGLSVGCSAAAAAVGAFVGGIVGGGGGGVTVGAATSIGGIPVSSTSPGISTNTSTCRSLYGLFTSIKTVRVAAFAYSLTCNWSS